MKFERFQELVRMMFAPDAAGNIITRYEKVDARDVHPLVLAYVGDAYFHLYVRMRLLAYEQSKVRLLDTFSAQIVSAVWQAKAYRGIEPILLEEERTIYRRARNTKSHAPRSATVAEYHASTGFEALLGSLYMRGETARLEEIAEAAFQIIAKEMMEQIRNNYNGN
ncbi:Mini-ribonuclease 3 [Selenomonas artemidis]|uniref:Mini-ribonuclease 3 n=1 Tax=Selenomonas artemidis TaxID=671224 RepID=UPI00288C2C3D|nr:ribonuclease III domain-containing protein [Selenomonas artemidis]